MNISCEIGSLKRLIWSDPFPTEIMKQNRSLILTSSTLGFIVFLLAVGSAPLAFAATPSPAAPALTSVNVTLSFSPKTITIAPGATVANTLTVKNKGTASITFTGCTFQIKPSTSKKYTKGTCSLGSPITVGAGKSVLETWDTTISSTDKAGTYNIRVYLTNSVDTSKAGTYNADVS
jgi:hypothetical protein